MKIASAVFLCLSLLLLCCGCGSGYNYYSSNDKPSAEPIVDDDLITLNEFNLLHAGMTRTEVYEIVGSFGEKVSETGQIGDDYHIVMYEYEGYGEVGANAQLMFTNGELDTMAQYGLQRYYGSTNKSSTVEEPTVTEESPIKISDLDFTFKIQPPNIIGTVYLESTYVNNSDYAITHMTLKILLKDQNTNTYLTCSDTVLPGETSSKFDSFGPETLLESDFELVKCDITAVDNNGEKVFITYDYKLDSYDVL